ncbi:hypothetical protein BCEP4_60091 [Burkholderia cepacia]|nr:hypothetical protein BCEP4_60091 [Burkholderia cepacia]
MRKHRGGATDVHRRTLVMGGFARADPFRMSEMQVSRLDGAFSGSGGSGGRAGSHMCNPSHACKRSLSTPRSEQPSALLLGLEMKKGRLEADLFRKQMVPRRGLEPPRCCHR